jgi:hypothetical protein
MLGRVALVRTEVSEELSASFIRLTKISELGTTLAVTSNRRTLLQTCSQLTDSCHPDDGGAMFLRNVGSYKSHTGSHPGRRHSSCVVTPADAKCDDHVLSTYKIKADRDICVVCTVSGTPLWKLLVRLWDYYLRLLLTRCQPCFINSASGNLRWHRFCDLVVRNMLLPLSEDVTHFRRHDVHLCLLQRTAIDRNLFRSTVVLDNKRGQGNFW